MDSTPEEDLHAARNPRRLYPTLWHYFWSAFGSISVGIALPSFLTILYISKTPEFQRSPVYDTLILLALAFIGCSPLAVLLSVILFAFLSTKVHKWTLRRAINLSALGGVLLAFLNIPGYGVFFYIIMHLGNNLMSDWLALTLILRVALLFIVAGASCGMWIGWQAWRSFSIDSKFIPRFSLGTLMLLVLMWATVMLAFQPYQPSKQSNPPSPSREWLPTPN